VDWLVEAKISQKGAVSIVMAEGSALKLEVTLLRNVGFYQPIHTVI
jgi:hypothetical protein